MPRAKAMRWTSSDTAQLKIKTARSFKNCGRFYFTAALAAN
jgi:hypothetical protein